MTTTTGSRNETRAAERRRAMAPSTLRAANRTATDVTVIDLSQTGLRIATEADLAVGEEISIGLAGVGARRAYVAWRRDGECGCAFDKPLAAREASDAFSSVSVVRLGTAAEVTQAVGTASKADLADLYGRHSAWRLPIDATLAIAGYLWLFGWAVWRVLLAR